MYGAAAEEVLDSTKYEIDDTITVSDDYVLTIKIRYNNQDFQGTFDTKTAVGSQYDVNQQSFVMSQFKCLRAATGKYGKITHDTTTVGIYFEPGFGLVPYSSNVEITPQLFKTTHDYTVDSDYYVVKNKTNVGNVLNVFKDVLHNRFLRYDVYKNETEWNVFYLKPLADVQPQQAIDQQCLRSVPAHSPYTQALKNTAIDFSSLLELSIFPYKSIIVNNLRATEEKNAEHKRTRG